MRRLFVLLAVVATTGLAASASLAGNPHQIGTCTVTQSGNSLSFSCKEAGLGDEAQIEVQFSATAECINPGSNHPKAANKTSVSFHGTEPVQNGKAVYTVTLTATFQPDCTPPMTVVFSNISGTDLTNNISLV